VLRTDVNGHIATYADSLLDFLEAFPGGNVFDRRFLCAGVTNPVLDEKIVFLIFGLKFESCTGRFELLKPV
jgi:hypothetical protein